MSPSRTVYPPLVAGLLAALRPAVPSLAAPQLASLARSLARLGWKDEGVARSIAARGCVLLRAGRGPVPGPAAGAQGPLSLSQVGAMRQGNRIEHMRKHMISTCPTF
jgi:hypothetical protein